MQQILLHPGFHRTGTSSIQHYLWQNRAVLAPYATVRLTRHFKPLSRACGRYAVSRNPLDLTDMIGALDAGFAADPVPTDRNLVISSEALCGKMPGLHGITAYDAAPALIAYLTGYLQERFADAQVRVLLTTRDADAWLFSAYRHALRRTRLRQTADEFAQTHAGAADLDAVVAAVAEAIAPLETLYLPLDHALTNAHGPGAALLDQLPLPDDIRARLMPVGVGAAGAAPHLWGQFLALNRSDAPDDQVRVQKEALAEAAKLGHWQKA